MKPKTVTFFSRFSPSAALLGVSLLLSPAILAADAGSGVLRASDGASGDSFGVGVSVSGGIALIGADLDDTGANTSQGSAYLFRNLDGGTGTITQTLKFTVAGAYQTFGTAVSLSGGTGLIGAPGANFYQGTAYIFRNLDTATGTISQNVQLNASDGASYDQFGSALSLSGSIGLVGASSHDTAGVSGQGAAYVFRNLDTATGTITQNVKLTASDGGDSDSFGTSVSLSGTIGLVGASVAWPDGRPTGAAYVFRNLDTVGGTVTENVKLTASDGVGWDYFGRSVSVDGTIGVVGANGANNFRGAAYVFRNLDAATGTITQDAKLVASDASDEFGRSVSLSGTHALVGATGNRAAYLFANLDTATGTVTEQVKITPSDTGGSYFGNSVSLDGDRFVIGAYQGNGSVSFSGQSYTGTVSSMTRLDLGDASRMIDLLSFVSKDDWIIGKTTDRNSVTLTSGDKATVNASGKSVAIGQDAGSDGNTLRIDGTLNASVIHIGAVSENLDNLLVLGSTGAITNATIRLAQENFLSLQGEYIDSGDLMTRLGSSTLLVWNGSAWVTVTNANQSSLLSSEYTGGYTTFSAIPEVSSYALAGIAALGIAFLRRRV